MGLVSTLKNLFAQKSIVEAPPPKNVSEPVLSFVQTFLKDPKRFRVKCSFSAHTFRAHYYLIDKKNKNYFGFFVRDNATCWVFPDSVGFDMTAEENKYLYDTIGKYYEDRKVRYKSLKEARASKKLYNQYKIQ